MESRGRPKIYQEQLYLEPLKRIWLATDQLCGKRLKWLYLCGCRITIRLMGVLIEPRFFCKNCFTS